MIDEWTTQEQKDPYRFGYEVKDVDDVNEHGRQEESDGQVITGSYHVVLPDGRKQIVKYKADPHSGFTADVIYEVKDQSKSSYANESQLQIDAPNPEYVAEYAPSPSPARNRNRPKSSNPAGRNKSSTYWKQDRKYVYKFI